MPVEIVPPFSVEARKSQSEAPRGPRRDDPAAGPDRHRLHRLLDPLVQRPRAPTPGHGARGKIKTSGAQQSQTTHERHRPDGLDDPVSGREAPASSFPPLPAPRGGPAESSRRWSRFCSPRPLGGFIGGRGNRAQRVRGESSDFEGVCECTVMRHQNTRV